MDEPLIEKKYYLNLILKYPFVYSFPQPPFPPEHHNLLNMQISRKRISRISFSIRIKTHKVK